MRVSVCGRMENISGADGFSKESLFSFAILGSNGECYSQPQIFLKFFMYHKVDVASSESFFKKERFIMFAYAMK